MITFGTQKKPVVPKACSAAGNQVVVAGNTMLSDDHIQKLVLLCMNREFMKFMRREYP